MEKLISDILNLIEQKRSSYGDSYFILREEFGPLVFIISIANKFNRLKSLYTNQKAQFFTETYEDTIKDIIGYCLLELYFSTKHKED